MKNGAAAARKWPETTAGALAEGGGYYPSRFGAAQWASIYMGFGHSVNTVDVKKP